MRKKNLYRLIGLNVTIIVINVMVMTLTGFTQYIGSDAIRPEETGEILGFATAITVLLLSIGIFIYGNIKILKSLENFGDKELYSDKYGYVLNEIDTAEECLDALSSVKSKVFEEDIRRAIGQIQLFLRKQESMRKILFQKCQSDVEEMVGIGNIVQDAEQLIYENVRHVLSRISIFDEYDYLELKSGKTYGLDSQSLAAKRKMYSDHLTYVKKQLDKTDSVLLEYDRLLTEISSIGDNYSSEQNQFEHIREVVDDMKKINQDSMLDKELNSLKERYSQY